jgi:uroporphyrinogen decarboxylase
MRSNLTSRQRVKAAINFQKVDRLPCDESLWPDTLDLWHTQGMPKDSEPVDYFGWDICGMALDCSPRFEQKILHEDPPWYTYQDRWGYNATKKLGKASSVHFFNHKTDSRETWDSHKYRWSLSNDPDEPARIDSASYFEHFKPYPTWPEALEKYNKLYSTERYMLFNSYGPWESNWRHCGYEELLMHTALEPEWVTEMAEYHIDLLISVLERGLREGLKPDGFFLVDDLAGTSGMLFSPKSWRRLFKPSIAKLGKFLKENDIDFWMHCCGNAEAVFPDLIEAGVRVINPLQATAGLNIVDLRKKYGKQLAFYGNISVVKMSGPQDELENEIRSKVSVGKDGGFVFHSDHSVPPEVDFDRYEWILKTARAYFHELQD